MPARNSDSTIRDQRAPKKRFDLALAAADRVIERALSPGKYPRGETWRGVPSAEHIVRARAHWKGLKAKRVTEVALFSMPYRAGPYRRHTVPYPICAMPRIAMIDAYFEVAAKATMRANGYPQYRQQNRQGGDRGGG